MTGAGGEPVTAYVDTSAFLRLVLREPGAIEGLRSYDALVSSELIGVESCRTIDRLRLHGSLTTAEAAVRLKVVADWLEAIDLVLLRLPVLSRASEPLPTPLGTLDALHLTTALIWRERVGALPIMATHDAALGLAAQTFGFDVVGV
jgi:predicted nucleic acid-binding protein